MAIGLIKLPRATILFGRLLLFILPVFIILVAVGLYIVYDERLIVARDSFSMRIGNTLGRTAGSLDTILTSETHSDPDKRAIAQQIVLLLLGDQAIKCATLTPAGSDEPILVAPVGLGCQFRKVDEWLSVDLIAPEWGRLRIGYNSDEMKLIRQSQIRYSLIVLMLSLTAALLSSWLAFRSIVGKPLNTLVEDLVVARDAAQHASEVKTRFLANISHEIRTPMNGIIGTAEFIDDSDLKDHQRGSVQTIVDSANSLMELIEDIIEFAQLDRSELKLRSTELNLTSMIYDVSNLFSANASKKGIELIIDCPVDEGFKVIGDGGRLRQVLLNLLGNAIKFTLEGAVTLQVRVVPHDGVLNVTFRVVDTGIGIPNDKITDIFLPFTQADDASTRQYGGSGLGLTISSNLVERLGGTLQVQSEYGKGSTFEFTVALEPCATFDPPEAIVLLKKAVQPQPFRALIVAASETNPSLLQSRLGNWGIACDVVVKPWETMARMESALAEQAPYNVVIIDGTMLEPVASEIGSAIRDHPRVAQTPLLLLSTVKALAQAPQELNQMFNSVLTKPPRPENLAQTLIGLTDEGLEDTKTAVDEKTVEATKVFAGAQFLLVDDDEINLKVLSNQLAKTGASLSFAHNGVEAVEAVAKSRPDVILMDISMPIMNGFDAAKEIRAFEKDQSGKPILIFAVSANVLQSQRTASKDAGMDGFIAKPIRKDNLIAVILENWSRIAGSQDSGSFDQEAGSVTVGPANNGIEHKSFLNHDTLEELRYLIGNDKLRDLAKKLSDQCDKGLIEIAKHIEGANPADAAAVAHKLSGSTASLGCDEIGAAFSGLEHLLGDSIDPRSALVSVSATWTKTKAELSVAVEQ